MTDRRFRRQRLAVTVLGALLVVLYAPLVHLVVASVNANPSSTTWSGFTTRWYREAWQDAAVRRSVGTSIRIALLSAVGATSAATLAVLAVRRRRWFQRIHTAFVTGRIGTPEIVIATGLGAFLPAIGVGYGFTAIAAAHTAYLSAFAAVLVGARAAGLDPHLEDVALDLGARPRRVLWRVVLPDLWPGVLSALLLSAAFSFDDVALSLALRGPDDTTLPVLLLSSIQRRVTPQIHAIGTAVLVSGVTVFAIAALANRSIVASTHRRQ